MLNGYPPEYAHKVCSRPFKFLRHPADGILGIQKIITVQQSDYIPVAALMPLLMPRTFLCRALR